MKSHLEYMVYGGILLEHPMNHLDEVDIENLLVSRARFAISFAYDKAPLLCLCDYCSSQVRRGQRKLLSATRSTPLNVHKHRSTENWRMRAF